MDGWGLKNKKWGEDVYQGRTRERPPVAQFTLGAQTCLVFQKQSADTVCKHEDQMTVGQMEVANQHYTIVVLAQGAPTNQRTKTLNQILTKREIQIVTLVAEGFVNKQIADKLKISEWTVSTHLRRIFAKLGVDSRASMVFQCANLL